MNLPEDAHTRRIRSGLYESIPCQGNLKLISKIIMAASIFEMSSR